MTSIWRRSLAWHVYQLKLLASYALFDCVGDERNVTELNAVGFFGWKVPHGCIKLHPIWPGVCFSWH